MKKYSACILLLLVISNVFAQQPTACYPTNWWVGMKNTSLQLMLHGEGIGNAGNFSLSHPGVTITKTTRPANKNYVFLDLKISPSTRPGKTKIKASGGTTIDFELKSRRTGNGSTFAKGVTSSDFMYLIMPDRFSNGDPSNDRIPGMLDQSLNRDSIFERHGGDLKGISNHLDYLQQLGVTTLWLNPVIINDMKERTEHGYAFTNHYKIDPRIGGDTAYHQLITDIHNRGMKIIQDAVYNHVGIEHFSVKDPPTPDWLHQWPRYTNTTYKDQVMFDPYASGADKKQMTDGWFTPSMPDLNQSNPLVANFLIQHAIWTVENFGIDGWRIDTYAYNDLAFMNRCNKALYDEYPKLTLFGETWVHGVPNQSFFCENNYNISFKSNLQATTDFQLLFYGIQEALTKPFGWTDGVNRMYTTAAQDFAYKDPMRQVIFLDNHDLPRFYSVVGEDLQKYKVGLAWLMTFRGIPQLYYGAEILMTGFTNPDGWVRLDFKGGWPGDAVNKFTAAGRTEKENEAFNYLKTFANYRKNSPALKEGKLMQFTPEDGVYVYFRYTAQQTIMCILNQNDTEKTITMNRFAERIGSRKKAFDIATGTTFDLDSTLKIGGKYLLALELRQ
ncbi:MAG: glycoside hydrolase family 13 protein [Gemmatimonadaceae bacterium]|nr:glycoside hydrolase family 13 protein [Chitinophagaceae bacterium]